MIKLERKKINNIFYLVSVQFFYQNRKKKQNAYDSRSEHKGQEKKKKNAMKLLEDEKVFKRER